MCSTSLYLDGTARMGLLREARRGDRESLAKLILPYGPGLYLGALRLTRNPADAEDVRQEAFLKAVSRLEQFAGSPDETRDDLRAWVSRIAANASIDVIRKRRDGRLFSLEESGGPAEETLGSNVATPEDNPEERFARREIRKLMSDEIAQLSPELRQVCLLRDVFRAHRKLRERLSVALRPQKTRQAGAAHVVQVPRRGEERIREAGIPLGAFAECACGD
jgi:RNA polymerase sigma factor (sigma-70 family)